MRVLVTGHRGYVGSVMVTVLRHAHYEVVGLDCDLYRGCDFGRMREPVNSFDIDLREIEFTDLLSFDAVIHLAALPEDMYRGADSAAAGEIDEDITIRLAECCKQARVSRFLFASCCGVYGRRGNDFVDESDRVDPTAPFAASKYRCERTLAALADHTFSPVLLRHASVFGVSPRLRTDLTVNGLVASALATGSVVLAGNGLAWHPLIHVEDLCRAYAAVLAAADDLVGGEVFNVAASEENYRLIDIADTVVELCPQSIRSVVRSRYGETGHCVDGAKLWGTFPRLSPRWTLPTGVRQLRTAMVASGFTPGDCRSDRYRRAMRIETLKERGDLSPSYRYLELATA